MEDSRAKEEKKELKFCVVDSSGGGRGMEWKNGNALVVNPLCLEGKQDEMREKEKMLI